MKYYHFKPRDDSKAVIMKVIHLALVSSCSTLCHSWSVMCGMPLITRPHSWLPCRDRNRCSASSVILSEESRSRPTRFLKPATYMFR